MKSLNDRYTSTPSGVYETFADLIFCALIVLVLFVMTLAIEVNQRVRSKLAQTPDVTVVDNIELLSAEEVAELSERLQQQKAAMVQQQKEIAELKRRAEQQRDEIKARISALNGEQRFTGATEPASVLLAYNYKTDSIIFVRRKEFDSATTRRGGESYSDYNTRSTKELVALALACREQRGYSIAEANSIYAAFTEYQQINPDTRSGYSISSERLNVTYGSLLSGYIAGDSSLSAAAQELIELTINTNFSTTNGASKAMYPSVSINVLNEPKRLVLNDVLLTPKDLRDILLSMGGRGVLLDFSGYTDKPPEWLRNKVLEPTGYIGKTPKAAAE